jgi:hypothetical protein
VRRGSVILLDNFKSHVTEASYKTVKEDLGCNLCAIPANCTSAIQPLDVGVMGPYKAILPALWLLEEDNHDMTAAQKRRVAILRAIEAWDRITAESIVRSFHKTIPKPRV